MTERELRAVAEAIDNEWARDCRVIINGEEGFLSLKENKKTALAQAAISASNSQYVKGLVEALKELVYLKCIKETQPDIYRQRKERAWADAVTALQNLPEDLR